MEKIIVIIPGHYRTKASLNSEKPDIVRILGPDKEREGYWLTQDGKKLHESLIIEEYIPLNTMATSNKPQKPSINIFAGIGTDDEDSDDFEDEIIVSDLTVEPKKIEVLPNTEVPIVKLPHVTNQKESPIPFDVSVIEKIKIDNLNKKSKAKYGIEQHKKPEIEVNITVSLDYDLERLKTTIDLLDLDEDVIIDWIIKNSKFNVNSLIKEQIKLILNGQKDIKYGIDIVEELSKTAKKQPESSHQEHIIPNVYTTKQPTEVDNKLEEELDEIQKIINKHNPFNN